MELKELLKNQIVIRDCNFIPLVFTDIVVSTKVIAVGGVTLAKTINDKRKENLEPKFFKRYSLDEYIEIMDLDI